MTSPDDVDVINRLCLINNTRLKCLELAVETCGKHGSSSPSEILRVAREFTGFVPETESK